jgi:hypothetical protein
MNLLLKAGLAVFALLVATPLSAQQRDTTRYFYRPEVTYGMEGMNNPFTVVLQGGFEMLAYHQAERFDTFPYRFAGEIMHESLFSPFKTIREYGVANFINDEFIPYAPGRSNFSVMPNVTLHLIGGGFSYAWMEEYYRYHGVKHPVLAAAATAYFKNLMNEMVEVPPHKMAWVDPISDLYFWDLAAIVLFSQRSVKHFFSREVGIYNWGTMPVLVPSTRLVNTNAYFAMRPVHFRYPVKPVVITGLGALAGISFPVKNDHTVSVTGGLLTADVLFGAPGTNVAPSLEAVPAAGFFWDRNNSLMASALIRATAPVGIRVNMYPGVLKGAASGLGIYGETGPVKHAGLVWRIPGAGLGL